MRMLTSADCRTVFRQIRGGGGGGGCKLVISDICVNLLAKHDFGFIL